MRKALVLRTCLHLLRYRRHKKQLSHNSRMDLEALPPALQARGVRLHLQAHPHLRNRGTLYRFKDHPSKHPERRLLLPQVPLPLLRAHLGALHRQECPQAAHKCPLVRFYRRSHPRCARAFA